MAKQKEVNNLGLQQLKQDIKSGTFGRLYLFYGEERYLQEHYLSQLKKKLVSGPMEDFNYRRLTEENTDLLSLTDAVEAMPMMAERVLVQVDDFDLLGQNSADCEELAALLSDLPDTCCLVFNYDTVTFSKTAEKGEGEEGGKKNSKEKKKLLQVLEEYGCLVEFAKQSPAELADWVSRHFRALEKNIAPELCQYLVFRTDGTMTSLHTEIEKVASYSRGPAVTRQEIDAVVDAALSAVIFDITDAFAEGDYDKALQKLRDVLQTKEQPVVILGVIGAHFRKLLYVKTAVAAGQVDSEIMALLATRSDFYCRKLKQQAARLQEEFLLQAVKICYEADCKMKRSFDDAPRILELLLLTLAQEAAK